MPCATYVHFVAEHGGLVGRKVLERNVGRRELHQKVLRDNDCEAIDRDCTARVVRVISGNSCFEATLNKERRTRGDVSEMSTIGSLAVCICWKLTLGPS